MWTSTRCSSPYQSALQIPLQELAAALHHPGALGEGVEQVELQAGQLDRLASEVDLAGGRVDGQLGEVARWRGGRVGGAAALGRRSIARIRATSSRGETAW
jgi:hypothetical protein